MTNTKSEQQSDVFSCNMEARDHECDIQGVVNNAHYQHYFEHARHRYLLENDIDFAQLATEGINLMVAKIEIEYKAPLRAHDPFIVQVEPQRLSKLKVCFVQHLLNAQTLKTMAIAKTTVVTVNHLQKPLRHSPLDKLI